MASYRTREDIQRYILYVIVAALGLQESPDRSLLDQLKDY